MDRFGGDEVVRTPRHLLRKKSTPMAHLAIHTPSNSDHKSNYISKGSNTNTFSLFDVEVHSGSEVEVYERLPSSSTPSRQR